MTVTTLPRRRKGAGLADCWVTTLVDAYGLPEPERSWIKYRDPDDWLTSQPGVDPAVLMVSLARRADVAPWAARLGVVPSTSKDIYEYADGTWIAVVTDVAEVPGWQAGLKLRVFRTETR
jgi:hypothetical protein